MSGVRFLQAQPGQGLSELMPGRASLGPEMLTVVLLASQWLEDSGRTLVLHSTHSQGSSLSSTGSSASICS